MLARLQNRLTYANVVATLALFFALGGSAYAVAKITSRDVADRSLKGIDIRRDSLTGKEIKESSLGRVAHAGDAATATNAANAQSANVAKFAGVAGAAANAQTLDGLTSGVFERASRTQFGAGSSSPPTPDSEGLLLEWDALGLRITAPAQGGCSNPANLTLHIVHSSGASLHVFGGASSNMVLSPGSSTIACSTTPRWDGVITNEGDLRTLFFSCQRLASDVRCIGTRSEP
jgi:hypothetical protein